jgi:hypothetical protein
VVRDAQEKRHQRPPVSSQGTTPGYHHCDSKEPPGS